MSEIPNHQRTRDLEARLAQLQSNLSTVSSQNERLVRTLKEARERNRRSPGDTVVPAGERFDYGAEARPLVLSPLADGDVIDAVHAVRSS